MSPPCAWTSLSPQCCFWERGSSSGEVTCNRPSGDRGALRRWCCSAHPSWPWRLPRGASTCSRGPFWASSGSASAARCMPAPCSSCVRQGTCECAGDPQRPKRQNRGCLAASDRALRSATPRFSFTLPPHRPSFVLPHSSLPPHPSFFPLIPRPKRKSKLGLETRVERAAAVSENGLRRHAALWNAGGGCVGRMPGAALLLGSPQGRSRTLQPVGLG